MSNTEFKIPVDKVFEVFKKHLDSNKNTRVFFSGQYGIGKTFYLKEFFDTYKEEYDVYHLFPINYQISTNEDVLDLLKYDILLTLTEKYKDVFKSREVAGVEDNLLLFYSFCKDGFSLNNFLKTIANKGADVVGLFPEPNMQILSKLGHSMVSVLEFDESFQGFKKDYIAGEKKVAEDFLKQIKSKKSLESDPLSYLVNEKITLQKDKKKSILILDDLDRLDPEHIFRLLNIFSAHLNINDGGEDLPNKFGFDKVILVGDKRNIKSIFHHKYGERTDFGGYFNKFTSRDAFFFNNDEAVKEAIDSIIVPLGNRNTRIQEALGSNGIIRIFLHTILQDSIELKTKEKPNLRQILKLYKFSEEYSNQAKMSDSRYMQIIEQRLQLFDFCISILLEVFEGKENFIEVIDQVSLLSNENERDGNYSFMSRMLLYVVAPNDMPEGMNGNSRWDYDRRSFDLVVSESAVKVTNKSSGNIQSLFYVLLKKYIETGQYENKNLSKQL